MRIKFVVAALLALLAVEAWGAQSGPGCAIARLFTFEATVGLMTTGPDFSELHRDAVLTTIEEGKLEAIKGVASSPSYQAALKDFVVVATEYARNIAARPDELRVAYDVRAAALTSRYEQAVERVELEAKLACGD